MAQYERQCKNWLADFMAWTIPRSEAKESYILWTGLYTLACAVRRHFKVPRKYLGSWECNPNLYILFVGDPGSRKTTTADYNVDLLDDVPGLVGTPDQITMPKLLTQLVESLDTSMYINAGEWSEFVTKSGLEMYSFLTNAYDGRRRISVGTHLRGIELAERPCVNLLGATNPLWVAENMPASVLGGGFARRVIFVVESDVRRRQMFYNKTNVDAVYAEYRPKLVADLIHIGTALWGDFELDEEAQEFMEAWYQKNAMGTQKHNQKLFGYYESKPAFILKVAMLLHVAYSDTLMLTRQDIEEALITVEQTEPGLLRLLKGIGNNPYKLDSKAIFLYVKEKGTVELEELHREFSSAAEPNKLDELIAGLVKAGAVTMNMDQMKLRVSVRPGVEI